jgi:hypothetical protein
MITHNEEIIIQVMMEDPGHHAVSLYADRVIPYQLRGSRLGRRPALAQAPLTRPRREVVMDALVKILSPANRWRTMAGSRPWWDMALGCSFWPDLFGRDGWPIELTGRQA